MKNKLIPKHLKAGKILINEPVSESTYRTQPQLNINEQELLNFIQSNPDVEDLMMREYAVKHSTSPTSNQGVIVEAKKDNAKNNFFRGYNNFRYSHPWAKGLNWTPIVGDVMDGISLAGDINNKNYTSAAVGLGLMALPNFILKPLLKMNHFVKLAKDFNEVGTGLKNPYVRKNFYNWAKDPTFSLLFLNKYGYDASDLSLKKAKQIQKDLDEIENKYGVYPKNFSDFDVDDVLQDTKIGLLKADDLLLEYNDKINYLEKNNPILANIVKESPLYLDLIYDDFTSGKISNVEDYIKDLIILANTFYRRMRINNSDDFLHIRGRNANYGNKKKAMDVGNPNVVWNPLWSGSYGKYSRKYTPKQLTLSGDVSTWWDLRFPNLGKNITIDNDGMHSDYYATSDYIVKNLPGKSNLPVTRVITLYFKNKNLPSKYKASNAHMTFLSDEDAYIGDFYDVTDNFDLKNDKSTLGFKQGGSLITKHKSGKPITEIPRDNTNYERKTPLVKKKNNYSSYEEIVDAKVNEKLEEKKPILKKHTRTAPAWPVGGKRKA